MVDTEDKSPIKHGMQKLHVLIAPAGNKQYAADCLELNVTTTKPTAIEAANEITGLINEYILTGLELGILKKIVHKASHEELAIYETMEDFPYIDYNDLSYQVRDLIKSIECRLVNG